MANSLVLASTSTYRRELLGRLGLPFDCEAPGTDEAERPGEAPRARALRLAAAKAAAVKARRPADWVIGSDQVASCDLPGGRVVLDKPGTPGRWREQLLRISGRTVQFHTGVVLLGPGRRLEHVDLTEVTFRDFDAESAERYMRLDSALDCAGGFKSEGAGPVLMRRMRTEDPTALIGLPLIWVADALRQAGFPLP
jgi:septum formation protein